MDRQKIMERLKSVAVPVRVAGDEDDDDLDDDENNDDDEV